MCTSLWDSCTILWISCASVWDSLLVWNSCIDYGIAVLVYGIAVLVYVIAISVLTYVIAVLTCEIAVPFCRSDDRAFDVARDKNLSLLRNVQFVFGATQRPWGEVINHLYIVPRVKVKDLYICAPTGTTVSLVRHPVGTSGFTEAFDALVAATATCYISNVIEKVMA